MWKDILQIVSKKQYCPNMFEKKYLSKIAECPHPKSK